MNWSGMMSPGRSALCSEASGRSLSAASGSGPQAVRAARQDRLAMTGKRRIENLLGWCSPGAMSNGRARANPARTLANACRTPRCAFEADVAAFLANHRTPVRGEGGSALHGERKLVLPFGGHHVQLGRAAAAGGGEDDQPAVGREGRLLVVA